MKRFHRNVRAVKLAFHQRPEVLNGIRVNLAPHIFNRMVDYFVLVLLVQSDVGLQSIGEDCRSSFYLLTHERLHIVLAAKLHDLGANPSATFHESDNDGLVVINPARELGLFALVHVASFAADEGFINFYFMSRPTHLGRVERVLHRKAQPLKHEPCRLLSYTQGSSDLSAGDSVLAIADHPKCGHPLVEGERRVLENRPNFERELLIASTAKPNLASLDEVVSIRLAAGTN